MITIKNISFSKSGSDLFFLGACVQQNGPLPVFLWADLISDQYFVCKFVAILNICQYFFAKILNKVFK